MFEGLPDRLKAELVALAPEGAEIRVLANDGRKISVWKGGSTIT